MIDMRSIRQLSANHGVFMGDILLTGLNLLGVNSPGGARRARAEVTLDDAPPDAFLIIIPMNRGDSPFTLDADGVLSLGRDRIGRASVPAHDDAIGGYFRKSGQVLTLNPNSRSRCTGCAFCPNTLEAASDPRLRDIKTLHELLDALALESSREDSLSSVAEVTVSTGCYEQEDRAIQFLEGTREVLTQRGMQAQLGFLTSVLRTDAAFRRISERVGQLLLFVTLECFSRRDLLLKSTKASLLPEETADLMRRARSAGLQPTYNYIIGLDDLEYLPRLAELDREAEIFPNYQIYQSHNTLMDRIRAPQAETIEYYLTARRIIERYWETRQLRPESWRNYRPLWYYTFGSEALTGPRI